MNLPIAERELRIAARAPRTYRGRMIMCVVFGIMTSWMFWIMFKIGNLATVAPQTYAFIAHVALLMCMFSASVTADALSGEKRNGTLGLLFLTDLKGYDIVIGKLAAMGLITFYSLIAVIPILAMPVLMGGVSGGSIFRTALTLLNAIFLSLSIGLWVSARSWEQKRALNASVWVVISLLWLAPGIAAGIRFRYPQFSQLAELLELLSPMYQQTHASPFGFGMFRDNYWQSLAVTHVLAWAALLRACAILPRNWQDRASVSALGRWKRFWQELRYGSTEVRATLRARLLKVNAVHWLSSRERLAPANSWLFVLIVLIGWVVLWASIHFKVGPGGPAFFGVGIPAILALYIGFRIRTCAIAGEVIARDRVSGALELLLSTTLTERDVVRGQWLTFMRTILGPALAPIVIGAFVSIAFVIDEQPNNVGLLVYCYVALVIAYLSDLVASMWTGMWAACFSRTPQAAPGQAIIRLFPLPWLAFIGFASLGEWLGVLRDFEFVHGFTVWWLISMANNIFWIVRSRRMFYERLRPAAAERYQPPQMKTPWWRFGMRAQPTGEIVLSKAN